MRTMFRLLQRRRPVPAPTPNALLACPDCDADALCPIEWEMFGDEHWFMWLRCGQCGAWLDALVGNRTAAAIDVELDRQQAAIAAQADALERERMAAELEPFIAALRARPRRCQRLRVLTRAKETR